MDQTKGSLTSPGLVRASSIAVFAAVLIAVNLYAPVLINTVPPSKPNPSANMAPLPREIFNRSLYRSILQLWFSGHPMTSTVMTPATQKKWFAVGATPEEKAAFDLECKNAAMPALDFLSPEKYHLPTWEGFDADKRNTFALSEPFRARIVEDSQPIASRATEAIPPEWAHKEVPDELDHADIARAFVLLLDQLPRNIYRGVKDQHRVYSHYDRLARAIVHSIFNNTAPDSPTPELNGLDERDRLAHSPAHRLWFYMPLEHSEDLQDHNLLSTKIDDICALCDARGDAASKEFVEGPFKEFEVLHADLLRRFGRYPHRNEALGREPTKEEIDYLENGGQRFGTG
ncbi:MAG: hypothetical protein Q9162_001303 [Coniocarpon cinnabarinum]